MKRYRAATHPCKNDRQFSHPESTKYSYCRERVLISRLARALITHTRPAYQTHEHARRLDRTVTLEVSARFVSTRRSPREHTAAQMPWARWSQKCKTRVAPRRRSHSTGIRRYRQVALHTHVARFEQDLPRNSPTLVCAWSGALCRRPAKPLPPTRKAFAADRAPAQIMHACCTPVPPRMCMLPGMPSARSTQPKLARGGICGAY